MGDKCVEECPNGFYKNDKICSECGYLCLNCIDKNLCLTCGLNSYKLDSGNCICND